MKKERELQPIERLMLLEERVTALEQKTKRKAKDKNGTLVWEAYCKAYQVRYKSDPVRNAMVNKNCADLVKRVGIKDACALVKYFVKSNDQWYIKVVHQLRFCLKDCEGLVTKMRKGLVITRKSAAAAETVSAGLTASQKYLQKKHRSEK